jgi:hypothetical protein
VSARVLPLSSLQKFYIQFGQTPSYKIASALVYSKRKSTFQIGLAMTNALMVGTSNRLNESSSLRDLSISKLTFINNVAEKSKQS